jgi:PadR family transcriptional regulator, regulatory protein AphA
MSNPTEFAILGLLAERPRSGYDIKKEVEERLGHFWSESYGHIYPMLRRLHQRDLVVKRVERQEGRPDRNVYSLTDDGRRALGDWFADPPAPARPRNELLLRLFLGRHAPTEHLLRDVRAYGASVRESLAKLRAVEARVENDDDADADRVYWQLVLSFGISAFEALASWSEECETTLAAAEAGHEARPPPTGKD